MANEGMTADKLFDRWVNAPDIARSEFKADLSLLFEQTARGVVPAKATNDSCTEAGESYWNGFNYAIFLTQNAIDQKAKEIKG